MNSKRNLRKLNSDETRFFNFTFSFVFDRFDLCRLGSASPIPFFSFQTYVDVFNSLDSVNVTAITLSGVTILALIFNNEILKVGNARATNVHVYIPCKKKDGHKFQTKISRQSHFVRRTVTN